MFEHASAIVEHVRAGRVVALAVVTSTSGSAPRPAGTSMLVTPDGHVFGSVSGGCVESAVLVRAEEVIDGSPPTTEVFGYGDPQGYAAGLACGGAVEVLITRIGPDTDDAVLQMWRAVASGRTPDAGLGVLVRGVGIGRWEVDPDAAPGRGFVETPNGSVFVERPEPPADFVIYGGVDVAAPLARLARDAGYRVTVVDARPAFARPERFPESHEVVRSQPQAHLRRLDPRPSTVVCVLTHEDRFDVPLLVTALSMDLAFVGAMGSRSTTATRERVLRDAGVPAGDLARLHAPIGLDLGASTPFETALAVMAEVVAARHDRPGLPLTRTSGPLHGTVNPSPRPATRDRG